MVKVVARPQGRRCQDIRRLRYTRGDFNSKACISHAHVRSDKREWLSAAMGRQQKPCNHSINHV